MEKYSLMTNISHVDLNGAILWCKAVQIDNMAWDGLGSGDIRQIRGMGWGGMPIFTIWIPPDADIGYKDYEGGHCILMSDDGNHNLDRAIIITVNGEHSFAVFAEDIRQPIKTEELDSVLFGDEVDKRLFPYAGGINYPHIYWQPLPK